MCLRFRIVGLLSCFVFLVSESLLRADETSVRKFLQDYVLAFNAGNVTALEGMWSPQAVYVDHATGTRDEGRAKIIGDIRESLASSPTPKLAGNADYITLISADVASVQGTATLTVGEEASISRFSALVKKGEAGWMLQIVEEMPVESASATVKLDELQWFVGKWKEDGVDPRVETNVRFSIGNAFLVCTFIGIDDDGSQRQSSQVIGWDPRSQSLVVWSFHSDGSYGTGSITKEGNEYRFSTEQVLIDGRSASGTYVIQRLDADSYSVQLVAHEIEGEPQPSSPSVTMKRIPETNP